MGNVVNTNSGTDFSSVYPTILIDQSGNYVDVSVSGTFGDVDGPASAVSGHVATFNGTSGKIIQDGGTFINSINSQTGPAITFASAGAGITISQAANTITISGNAAMAGDVVGPASATDSAVALYDTTSGKLIKDSNLTYDNATARLVLGGTNADISPTPSGNLYLFAEDIGAGTYAQVDLLAAGQLVLTGGGNGNTFITIQPTDKIEFISNSGEIVGSSISGTTFTNANGANTQILDLDDTLSRARLSSNGATSSSVLNMNAASMDLTTSSVAGGGALTINPTNAKLEFSNGGGSNYISLSGSAIVTLGDFHPSVSGSNQIGTPAIPYSGINTRFLNTKVVTAGQYNEVPTGAIDGINSAYTLFTAPYSTSLQLYKNGLYMAASGLGAGSIDFVLATNTITFLTPPASGSTLLANYNYVI